MATAIYFTPVRGDRSNIVPDGHAGDCPNGNEQLTLFLEVKDPW